MRTMESWSNLKLINHLINGTTGSKSIINEINYRLDEGRFPVINTIWSKEAPRGLKQLRGLSYFSVAWRALREKGLEELVKGDSLPKQKNGLKILPMTWTDLKLWCDRVEKILIRLADLECFLDGKCRPYESHEVVNFALPGYLSDYDYHVAS